MDIRSNLKESIASSLKGLGIFVEAGKVPLEHPAELKNGDYSSGVALQYAKQAGSAPRALADKIVASLGAVDGISKIEVAGAGFINFFLSKEALYKELENARRKAKKWGTNNLYKGHTVLVEYTSPNLFKPLHVGNLVGNIVGEAIARLYDKSGAIVKRINYPSDIGLTVAKGVWGLKQMKGNPEKISDLGKAYQRGNDAYENEEVAKAEINSINKILYEASDIELNRLREVGIRTSLRHLDLICRKLGTKFNYELFESQAGELGKQLVRNKIDAGVFERSEGAIIYRGKHVRVFLTSQGLPTYEAKDIGNFELKRRKYPDLTDYIVITGKEQKDYFEVIIEVIRKLFPDSRDLNLTHIATGFLTPTTGKMSSRKGNVITGESILKDLRKQARLRAKDSRVKGHQALAEKISIAGIKYQVLRQSTGADIIFDKDRALSFEGDSGPYLQYAHARANQLIATVIEPKKFIKFDYSVEPNEIVRFLHRFPEEIERSVNLKEPHLVTNYLLHLAASFNSWYAQTKILDRTDGSAHKVAITDAVRVTLRNGLWILGIPAPEKM